MEHYSPLRYPGGKGKISHYFKNIIKNNLLFDCIYVEPFAGGASVALSLLFNEYASKIIINDIDRSIYAFWFSVLHHTDKLCKLIIDAPLTISMWKKQKRIQKNKDQYSLLKLGFSTFYLNRTNRSGILNAGVIGGKKQKGMWKINARFNKEDLINRIKKIALYKDRIELYNLDAVELIKKLKGKLPKKSLFYFDPPYYYKGKDLYLNHYNNDDHIEVAKQIKKIGKSKWIITYDNVKPIRNIYRDYRQLKFNINYSAGQISKGQEVMVFSDNLNLIRKPIIA